MGIGKRNSAIETLGNICELAETKLECLLLSEAKCQVGPLIIDDHFRHSESWPTQTDDIFDPEGDEETDESSTTEEAVEAPEDEETEEDEIEEKHKKLAWKLKTHTSIIK